jgi:putative phosphoribosyl transferase
VGFPNVNHIDTAICGCGRQKCHLGAQRQLRAVKDLTGLPAMVETPIATRIIAVGPRKLEGILRDSEGVAGLVIFAHGAGSSRLSPRNNYVAERLGERGIATLLFDLLTEEEALDRANVFDIPLLSGRMIEAVRWARGEPELSDRTIGLFGASTGAAAAVLITSSLS